MLSNSLPEPIRAKLAEFEREYRRAESALKLLEVDDLQAGLSVPALNEFRYAGAHLSRIFATEAEATTDEAVSAEIDQAIAHLKRANYDAYNATILFYLEKCDAFSDEYRFTTVATILPSFPDEQFKIDALKDKLIKENRDKRDTEERDEYDVENNEQQLILVKEISQKWERYRGEINKERYKIRRQTILAGVAILVMFVLVIVTLL